MPAGVQTYYLRGGPCNGETGDLQPNTGAPPHIDCGGHRYNKDVSLPRVNGALVYRDTGPVPQPSSSAGTPRTHGGWRDLRHSFNVNMVRDLGAAQHSTRAALRSLSRARKVRL